MRHSLKCMIIAGILLLGSCSSQQSLQEYYVDNSENPNFIVVDVPASILKLDAVELTDTQREAVESLRKLNLLAFKKHEDNAEAYEVEKNKIRSILKNGKYEELMKINSHYGKGMVKYLGDEDAIDEVIIYGDSDEMGFAVVRVLGKKMNPAHIVQLIQAIQKSDMDEDVLGEIGQFLKG